MPDKHALLSASSAHRWLKCTPSVRLEEEIPYEGSSSYAAEGTLAHSIAEWKVDRYLIPGIGTMSFCPEPQDEEMDRCTDMYKDFVEEEYKVLLKETKDALLLTEQKLEFGEYVPDGFGTADCVIISDKTLEVIDFKYGKGVPVSADDNPQLRLYALGAYLRFSVLYDFEQVKTVIFQPRLDSVTSECITTEALLEWADSFVKKRAELAYKGLGAFVVGDHCRFCRAAAICRARAEAAFNMLDSEEVHTTVPLLHDSEIPGILDRIPNAEAWIASIKEYARDKAIREGVKWEGYKLVEARTQRKISDQIGVMAKLEEEGYSAEDVTNTKLKGLTELQKVLGKKKFEELLEPYIVKPQGEPTLVPESDKRPEINPVEKAFKEEIE